MKTSYAKHECSTPLTVDKCARRLGISSRHVSDLIEEGKLRAVNVAGANATNRKFWRVPEEALEAFQNHNASV